MSARPPRPCGRVLPFVVPPLVFALLLAEACGGASGGSPGASPDGGSGSIPGPGTGTLTGSGAFPVGSAQMGESLTGACGGSAAPGVIPTVSILLTSQGLPAVLCSDAGLPDGGTGYLLDIEIATTQAAMGDEVLTQSIVPGTYEVGDEGEDDPDLCMLAPGSNAFLQIVTPTSGDAVATAISGSVTIDSISAGAVTGTFSVLMGGPYGVADASPPPSLSGAFNATACP
ncbi:MAG TPA: hypothetical protein VGG39_05895 [Polyangiaceae bacterium]